jgi:ubiquinone biosynthesis protein UbiJ
MTANAPAHPLDALKPLAGRLLEQALNRLLALDPDTRTELQALHDRRIALALEAPALALEIRVDGGQLRVGPAREDEPDLGIRATLAGALSQLPFLRPAGATPVGKVRISGDAELARTLQQLARRFDPDWERPFADALGPIVGPQVARLLRETLAGGRTVVESVLRDSAEFLTEESRDVLGKAELSAFHDDVDALRDDVERFAARVVRLQSRTSGDAS